MPCDRPHLIIPVGASGTLGVNATQILRVGPTGRGIVMEGNPEASSMSWTERYGVPLAIVGIGASIVAPTTVTVVGEALIDGTTLADVPLGDVRIRGQYRVSRYAVPSIRIPWESPLTLMVEADTQIFVLVEFAGLCRCCGDA